MHGFLFLIGLLGTVAFVGGCGRPESAAEPVKRVSGPRFPGHLDRALPRLRTIKLWLGDQELEVEIARSATEIQTGMMFRTNVAENAGMLFVFNRPIRASFYMKNVPIDLSCAYVAPDGKILEIHRLKAGVEAPVEAGTDRVQYVLETAEGWFDRHQVAPGTVIGTPYGGLSAVNWATLQPPPR